jgi:PQQ-dependent dehydrogenase (s-GDH family)
LAGVACLGVAGAVLASFIAWAQTGPESARIATKRFAMRVAVSGLENPWEIIWGPDGRLWVTERTALRITRVDPSSGERQVAANLAGLASAHGPGGVLGMTLHPQLLRNAGRDEVYVAVTYDDPARPPDARVTGPSSPFRRLYAKVIRLRYEPSTFALVDPVTVLDGLPAGNDHLGLRLAFAPDGTLHLTIGDQGGNQLGNVCNPVLSQRLPTQAEVDRRDWSAYEGKTLRLTTDGGIPADNPALAGVRSHVYTYGHRNPQGLTIGPDGAIYTTDHGPKTDDEVNVLAAGGNYGWPHVAGLRDDLNYVYARWADSTTPCAALRFSDLAIPASVPREPESAFRLPMMAPIATLFTVPAGYNFADPACGGVHFICWPTVAASSVESYAGFADGIPGWERVLLVSSLKRGSLYVISLDASGRRTVGPIAREVQTQNRYRDVAIHTDGRTIYIATDSDGLVDAPSGGVAKRVDNGGAILAFTYAGESAPADVRTPAGGPDADESRNRAGSAVPSASVASSNPSPAPRLPAPPFSRAQVTAGKIAYDASCAVCHGSTLMNGTFGTPLAGEYFRRQWSGRSVAELFEKSRTTMPPKATGLLSAETHAAIIAYVLEVNGSVPGDVDLPADAARLAAWRVP